MASNYTVIYSHPSGATATFIYEDGEMSALAKGLDAEQFWVFKQVKALLLRNEEDDLALATAMMKEHGFTAHVYQPLADLLAAPRPFGGNDYEDDDDGPVITYRHLPTPFEEFYQRPVNSHGEIHWREEAPRAQKPPHKAAALPLPQPAQDNAPVEQWVATNAAPARGEVHWREDH
jgi:hypothetical protein